MTNPLSRIARVAPPDSVTRSTYAPGASPASGTAPWILIGSPIVNEGDRVRVDTRSGEYVSRA